jgi:hypothetical protein
MMHYCRSEVRWAHQHAHLLVQLSPAVLPSRKRSATASEILVSPAHKMPAITSQQMVLPDPQYASHTYTWSIVLSSHLLPWVTLQHMTATHSDLLHVGAQLQSCRSCKTTPHSSLKHHRHSSQPGSPLAAWKKEYDVPCEFPSESCDLIATAPASSWPGGFNRNSTYRNSTAARVCPLDGCGDAAASARIIGRRLLQFTPTFSSVLLLSISPTHAPLVWQSAYASESLYAHLSLLTLPWRRTLSSSTTPKLRNAYVC